MKPIVGIISFIVTILLTFTLLVAMLASISPAGATALATVVVA